MSKRKTPESGVLKACLDLLAAHKIWHERRNTGAMRDGKRFVRFSRVGTADIQATPAIPCGAICCLPPQDEDERALWAQRHCERLTTKTLWIECKSEAGRQTEEQKRFQEEVEAAGHSYLLVRDVDTLRDWLRSRGAI